MNFRDIVGVRGLVVAQLFGSDGRLKMKLEQHNLVTDRGDALIAAGIYTAAYNGWGMKLGTATTAAAKNGAGSFIAVGDYIAGSARALDDSTPKQGGAANVVQFRRQWAPGEGTSNTVNRVAITTNTNDAGEADATGTFAISVFGQTIPKLAGDTLIVTWNVTMLGA